MVSPPSVPSSRLRGADHHPHRCSWAMGSIDSSVTTIADSAAAPENEVLVRTCSLPLDAVEAASTFLQAPRLYFAGDTGYRTVPVPNPTPEETEQQPHCPVFSTIGTLLGPFDLALLPIGLFLPRNIMSPVHCCPEDSVCVARDVGAKRSIGMHYGTVRGGLSGQYEGGFHLSLSAINTDDLAL